MDLIFLESKPVAHALPAPEFKRTGKIDPFVVFWFFFFLFLHLFLVESPQISTTIKDKVMLLQQNRKDVTFFLQALLSF